MSLVEGYTLVRIQCSAGPLTTALPHTAQGLLWQCFLRLHQQGISGKVTHCSQEIQPGCVFLPVSRTKHTQFLTTSKMLILISVLNKLIDQDWFYNSISMLSSHFWLDHWFSGSWLKLHFPLELSLSFHILEAKTRHSQNDHITPKSNNWLLRLHLCARHFKIPTHWILTTTP